MVQFSRVTKTCIKAVIKWNEIKSRLLKCVTLHGLIFNSRIQSDIICRTIARKIRACETSKMCALLTKHEIKMTSNCQVLFLASLLTELRSHGP